MHLLLQGGLPGQLSDSVESPLQKSGPGHVLDLVLVPSPQVTEQSPHSVQSVQSADFPVSIDRDRFKISL